MPKFNRFVDIVSDINTRTGEAAKWLLVPLTCIVFMEVFLRYLFNSPTIWSYELTEYLFGILSMIGGAYCMRFDVHVRMDVLRERLSDRGKAIVDLYTSFLAFIYLSVLIWKGFEFAWPALITLERSGSVWNPPYWPFILILPLSAIMMFLQAVAKLIYDVASITKKRIIS